MLTVSVSDVGTVWNRGRRKLLRRTVWGRRWVDCRSCPGNAALNGKHWRTTDTSGVAPLIFGTYLKVTIIARSSWEQEQFPGYQFVESIQETMCLMFFFCNTLKRVFRGGANIKCLNLTLKWKTWNFVCHPYLVYWARQHRKMKRF